MGSADGREGEGRGRLGSHAAQRTCPECGAALVLGAFAFFAYLDGYRWPPDRGFATCSGCQHFFDLWEVLLESVKFPAFPTLALTEGVRSIGTVRLPINATTVVRLRDCGIPGSARIVAYYVTMMLPGEQARASLFTPLLNQVVPPVSLDHELPVHVTTADSDYDTVQVSVSVSWIPHDDEAPPYTRLLDDAFDSLQQGDLPKALLLAHTALDFVLERVVLACLNEAWPGPKYKPGPGVSHNLKLAVLGALCRASRLPVLRPHILELACALNTERNKGVHPRKAQQPVSRDRAADLLCAAVFAVMHVERAGRSLLQVQSLWVDDDTVAPS